MTQTNRERATQVWLGSVAVSVAACAFAQPAAAQEFCVRCDAPTATYRCIIDNGSPQGITLKAMCVGILERDGKHAACRISDGTVFDCHGAKRRIDARVAGPLLTKGVPSPVVAQPTAAPATAPAAAVPADGGKATQKGTPAAPTASVPAAAPKPAGEATPKTVEQLARQTGKSTGEMIDKVGEGANKAWRCVASMFKTC